MPPAMAVASRRPTDRQTLLKTSLLCQTFGSLFRVWGRIMRRCSVRGATERTSGTCGRAKVESRSCGSGVHVMETSKHWP